MEPQHRDFLRGLFRVGVSAVTPAVCLPRHLPVPPSGRTVVVGAGKAAAAMASVTEGLWKGPLSGLVVTRYGHGVPCERIRVVEAGHPLPDSAGLEAAVRIQGLVADLDRQDLVLCLLSGGGSALLARPAPGLTLEDKQAVGASLLRSGATIAEINCVRKHLSAIKGGLLAAACFPARVFTLAISDVPGDDPSVIASGPTVPDPSTFTQALAVLSRYHVNAPQAVCDHLEAGIRGEIEETPKPGDPRMAQSSVEIVATAEDALIAAALRSHALGVTPLTLGGAVEGEARAVAAEHAALVRQLVARSAQPGDSSKGPGHDRQWPALRLRPGECPPQVALPCVLLSGGETSVTVRGRGRGGRNTEYLLALALALDGHPGVHALAADTDGIDGTEDDAGALVAPDTLARAHAAGVDPCALLADNDSHRFFATLDDLVVTAPTRTNVNDFRAILITPDALKTQPSREDQDVAAGSR
jgi:glycerate 2-kinase